MKLQRCIVEIINITRKGEVKHFQVRIPENAKYLTGIETALRLKGAIAIAGNTTVIFNKGTLLNGGSSGGFPAVNPPAFGFSPPVFDGLPTLRSLAGELKLQSSEEANIFYATNVVDPSVNENLNNIPTPSAIVENVWTHGYKRELEKIRVNGNTTVLSGIYTDKMGAMQNRDIAYDVYLYVWYRLKTEKTKKQICLV